MLSRFRRHLAFAGVAAAFLLALSAGIAQAEAPKLISYGNFNAVTEDPMGVAVDPSSGDIYVAGFFDPSQAPIDKFDAADKLLSPPSAFGEAGSFHGGAAVNPTDGDLYVIDAGNEAIDTYDPNSGALLASFPVSGFGGASEVLFHGIGIAADSAGNVYVPSPSNNEVVKYSPSGTMLQTFTGSGGSALKEPTGVAVDSSGDVWIVDAGNNRIEELSSTGTLVGDIESEGVRALALGARGEVFATVYNSADSCGALQSPCAHLVEYGPTGTQVADVGAGFFEAVEGFRGLPAMVAANASSGRVYVTDLDKDVVWTFGPPAEPQISKELVSEGGTSEAKLGALINPGGIATSYRFEYDTREYREGEAPHGQTTPFPEGSVGEGFTSHVVWAAVSGLAPGTTYHYRVVATNEVGTIAGPDQTFTTKTAAQAACPNEPFRGGFSARLPDCRAYELVTPPTKNSVQFDKTGAFRQIAPDGNRISFNSNEPLPGARAGGLNYLAIRGEDGWTSEAMLPLQSYSAMFCGEAGGVFYSHDMTKAVVSVGRGDRASSPSDQGGEQGLCGGEGVQVVSGEPLGYENLLLRDNADTYQLINASPPGVAPADAHFQGASADQSRVIFSEQAQLTPNAPGEVENLYEWDEGVLRLVAVLPNGTPVAGSLAGPPEGLESNGHAVSVDGSRVFFTAGGKLYVRLSGSRTAQIDASQAGGVGGGGTFWAASADGSRVLFSDEASAALTGDTVPGSGQNLYEYDVENGELTDLTSATTADLQRVIAVSEDDSYAYFLAQGSLAPGATEGQENLYVSHGGKTMLIATFAVGQFGKARVSSDGAWFAFASSKSLTGYDNVEPNGLAAEEIFLYDAAAAELVCASCNPSGEAPIAAGGSGLLGGEFQVSAGGRLFFDTNEALVPSDTDGQVDVYEYEGGDLHLISGGTSSIESQLIEVNASGDDVFFLTNQRLVPQDTQEEGGVIYDARVDGGFSAVSLPPPCSTADACRTAVSPQPSIYGAPSSQTFSGAGNLVTSAASKPAIKPESKAAKCRRSFVKKKGRCIDKHKPKARRPVHFNKAGK